jgi:hypothetical protein
MQHDESKAGIPASVERVFLTVSTPIGQWPRLICSICLHLTLALAASLADEE